MRLSELKTGESATILKVLGHGGFRRRIMEMGFVRGQRVEVVLNAPLEDPIEYKIMGYGISLRRSEADMIVVLSDAEVQHLIEEERHSGNRRDALRRISEKGRRNHPPSGAAFAEYPDENDTCRQADEIITRQSHTIAVALVGNPNSGKTSLFNAISGGREHVGNYSGVTVGAKIGHCNYRGYRFEITDLPGTYALSAYTPEERFVRTHIAEKTPDVIINSVVASNLERNLYLTTELIDINPRMVVALNMFDELTASGAKLDYDHLGRMLGVPMIPVEARNNKGIDELLDTVIAVYENQDARVRHIHINQGPVIEESLQKLNGAIGACRDELPKAFPPRYFAMKLLEGDKQVEAQLRSCAHYAEWTAIRDREAKRITEALDEDVETAFANQKYGFISGALKETYTAGQREEATATALIDTFVTHKLWGFPIFFLLMGFMFWCTFRIGAYPQGWIETLVGWLSEALNLLLPEGTLRDLLCDGIIGGVGSVIVFLPNIMILYLFISFMEDSGYLARAAFIMDRVMHRLGLHGKSFIPLIMGFGCNVPAIMACRTIESRSSRLITILITPFMSCSARIPIYLLLTGTFFAAEAVWVMTGLYLIGVLAAILTARLMRRFLFPADETPFVMELPPYRLPTWKTTLSHMWDKCAQYLRKMGGMILVASIVVWFLNYYPQPDRDARLSDEQPYTSQPNYEHSYLGRIGKSCEPVFRPLGLDWKASVALLSGFPAKEIVVSTLGVLYAETEVPKIRPVETDSEIAIIGGTDGVAEVLVSPDESSDARPDDETASLSQRLIASGDFTTASVLAFLVFILLYIPCIATVTAIGTEAGWKWAGLSLIYNTGLAWIAAWIVYRLVLWL